MNNTQLHNRIVGKRRSAVLLLVLVLPLLAAPALHGQNKDSTSLKRRSEPMELPPLIIFGSENLNIRGGRKAAPTVGKRLNAEDLNRLNSLEKQPPPLLGTVELPVPETERSPWNGFLHAGIGMYPTVEVLGGFSTALGGYNLDARGGFNAGEGHTDNADFSEFMLEIGSIYIAPEKFWIFGGSKTTTNVGYRGRSYKLYAVEAAPERTVRDINLGLDVAGEYDGFHYDAAIGLDHASLAQDGDVTNTSVNGHLALRHAWREYTIGGHIRLDLQNLRSQGMEFLELAGLGRHESASLRIDTRVGAQIAGNSRQESQAGLVAEVRGDFFLSENITARARVYSGLENSSYRKHLHANPYLADTADVLYERTVLGGKGQIVYHPTSAFSLAADVGLRQMDNLAVYLADTAGAFYTSYREAALVAIGLETVWQPAEQDRLGARAELHSATLSEGSTDVPNIAPLTLSMNYTRRWLPDFYTTVKLAYIGERNADIENTLKLEAYADLGFSMAYRVFSDLSVSLDVDNLLGAEVYRWQGYKERGIFAMLAANWRF